MRTIKLFSTFFLKVCDNIYPFFAGGGQHDSMEFMTFLLERLHEDLNPLQQNNSIVVDIFGGLEESQLTCSPCGGTSVTSTPYKFLSLEVPPNGDAVSLMSCLDSYIKEEKLGEEEKW